MEKNAIILNGETFKYTNKGSNDCSNCALKNKCEDNFLEEDFLCCLFKEDNSKLGHFEKI